jgi:lipid-A-disaccharide synthase-like uncharacterized protein
MMENWRALLYYPLGILPGLFFFLRFYIQWLKSEKKRESFVDQTFWLLSSFGNFFSACHYFIQIQYWFLLIQTANFGIAYRNIDLLNKKKEPLTLKKFVMLLLILLISVSLLFFLQKYLFFSHLDLFATPVGMMQNKDVISVALGWQLLGFLGSALFASRFWYQWWNAEKNRASQLDKVFWKLSLLGNLVVLVYFFVIQDIVSIINYSFGMIPYTRNLILLHRKAIIEN